MSRHVVARELAVATHDARTYTYDDRNNVINIHGEYLTGGNWHAYDVASAFDARGRRVFKVFTDTTTNAQAEWLFDYDSADRLTEVKYTPDTSSPSTYDVFQLVWLRERLVAYWQTTYPAATTSRRYVTSDEAGRPFEMWNWPTGTGNATRVWAVNPTAWGGDMPLLGATVFQPQLFPRQTIDPETASLSDTGSVARAALALHGTRTYDPFTGTYLQIDPRADSTWSSYIYAGSDPVGYPDSNGRANDTGYLYDPDNAQPSFSISPSALTTILNNPHGDDQENVTELYFVQMVVPTCESGLFLDQITEEPERQLPWPSHVAEFADALVAGWTPGPCRPTYRPIAVQCNSFCGGEFRCVVIETDSFAGQPPSNQLFGHAIPYDPMSGRWDLMKTQSCPCEAGKACFEGDVGFDPTIHEGGVIQ